MPACGLPLPGAEPHCHRRGWLLSQGSPGSFTRQALLGPAHDPLRYIYYKLRPGDPSTLHSIPSLPASIPSLAWSGMCFSVSPLNWVFHRWIKFPAIQHRMAFFPQRERDRQSDSLLSSPHTLFYKRSKFFLSLSLTKLALNSLHRPSYPWAPSWQSSGLSLWVQNYVCTITRRQEHFKRKTWSWRILQANLKIQVGTQRAQKNQSSLDEAWS